MECSTFNIYRGLDNSFGMLAPLQEKGRPQPPLDNWQDRNATGRAVPLKFLDFKLIFAVCLSCNKYSIKFFFTLQQPKISKTYSYLLKNFSFFCNLMINLHEFLHVLRWPRPHKYLFYKRIK